MSCSTNNCTLKQCYKDGCTNCINCKFSDVKYPSNNSNDISKYNISLLNNIGVYINAGIINEDLEFNSKYKNILNEYFRLSKKKNEDSYEIASINEYIDDYMDSKIDNNEQLQIRFNNKSTTSVSSYYLVYIYIITLSVIYIKILQFWFSMNNSLNSVLLMGVITTLLIISVLFFLTLTR